MSCNHILLQVPPQTYEPLITFLTTSLSHLSFREHQRPVPGVVGLGVERPWLWFDGREIEGTDVEAIATVLTGTHVAFGAGSTFSDSSALD